MTAAPQSPIPNPQSAIQTEFWESFFSPLVEIDHAQLLLTDVSRDHVVWMIESGALGAVNIALNPSGIERSLRVWRWTIERRNYTAVANIIARRGKPPVESLLPHSRPHFLAREVRTLLSCSDQHVANLAKTGQLTGEYLGTQRFLRITRPSLIAFLQTREV